MIFGGERERGWVARRERERETDRQTEIEREREREKKPENMGEEGSELWFIPIRICDDIYRHNCLKCCQKLVQNSTVQFNIIKIILGRDDMATIVPGGTRSQAREGRIAL